MKSLENNVLMQEMNLNEIQDMNGGIPGLYFARYNFVQNKKVSIFMLSRHKNDAYYKIYR